MEKISQSQFNQIASSDDPVLIKFGATWCQPCKALEPQLVKYAQTPGAVRVVEVDIDEEGALAAQFGVQAVPTMVLLKSGVPLTRMQGVMGAGKIAQEIASKL